MIIKGNTVCTNMPRSDYEQTDSTKADFIRNKPNKAIEKAQSTADSAKTAADSAKTAADNAQSTADSKAKAFSITVTLSVSGWQNNEQTVSAPGVTSDEEKCHVIVSPVEASREIYNDVVVRCVAQGDGTLTFACDEVPETDLLVGVLVLV